MDDVLLVGGFDRLGDLQREGQRFSERDRPAREPLGQRFAVDQFENQELLAVALFESIDRRDVG
jgi:hypothetical protein